MKLSRSATIGGGACLGVVLCILVITFVVHDRDRGDKKPEDPHAPMAVANSFPAPLGAVQASPDTVTASTATKVWRAQGATIEQACSQWREAYRGWVDAGSIGSITGDDETGRRCTLSGPKDGNRADLSVTVYGDDPVPSVTLSVRKQ